MTAMIVDTNVPLVANGMCEGVAAKCRLAVIDFLESLLHEGRLVVDLEGLIEKEYRRHLGVGSPGVGSRFLQKFFSEASNRIDRVSLETLKNGTFKAISFDGSLKKFDPSDRKFVALAVVTGFAIYNATDSDWVEHHAELKKRGVHVEFICGCSKSDWFS